MYKILFVDDDAALRNVVYQYFKERQYDIICTASADKAVSCLKSASIDCVILDVNLPDMNGGTIPAVPFFIKKARALGNLVNCVLII